MNDDIDEQYRQSSAREAGEPGEATRRRILEHAATLAAQRAAAGDEFRGNSAPPRRRLQWRRPALFGTLAAAAVAGLMVVPQFLRRDTAPVYATVAPAELSPATSAAQRQSLTALRALPQKAAQAPAAAPALASAGAGRGLASAGAATAAMARSFDGAAVERAAPADIDARDATGRTALLNAVLRGDAVTVTSLLARGANPDLAGPDGLSPLQAAVAGNQPAIAALLRQAGAR
jgi:hypothetical protein